MVYMGSKNKLSKHLKPIIESYLSEGKIYVEPFVGGANMIDKIEWDHKFGYDINKPIIQLLKYGAYSAALCDKKGIEFKLPYDEINKEVFVKYREDFKNGKASPKIGFVGLMTQLGNFYISFQQDEEKRAQIKRSMEKQFSKPLFYNTVFEYSDYRDLEIKNAVIYCDPPYHNTSKYTINNKNNKFNYDEFLKKCEQWYNEGNIVLLSGNYAPNINWRVLFEKEYTYNMYDRVKQVKELLMIYEPKKHPNCWFWNHHR